MTQLDLPVQPQNVQFASDAAAFSGTADQFMRSSLPRLRLRGSIDCTLCQPKAFTLLIPLTLRGDELKLVTNSTSESTRSRPMGTEAVTGDGQATLG